MYIYIYIYIRYICIIYNIYIYIYIIYITIKNNNSNVNDENDNSNSNERKLSYCLKKVLLIVLLKGTKFFTFNLKELRLSGCFNSTGTKNNNDSVPWYTEHT